MDIISTEERALLDASPEAGFVNRFKDWAAMKTDAPTYALEAAALMALSTAAGDTVVLPGIFSDQPIYMNLYIILVGPSTTMRKTTVLNYVRGLLPQNQQTQQDYITFIDDISSQAFNKSMADSGNLMAPIVFNVDEVAGLFQVVRKQNSYLAGFDKVLMKAYDHSPVAVRRTNSNIEAQRGAFVNIWAASTPDPLMEVLDAEDVESGLLPRFLVFDAREAMRGDRLSLMKRRAIDSVWADEKVKLKTFLYKIAKDRADGIPTGGGPETPVFPQTFIDYSDGALERLDAIDAVFSKEAGKDTTAWGAIKGRAFWHIVKLAGLYALSRSGLTAKVEVIDVLRAARLVEETVSDLGKMQEEVGSNHMERQINDILGFIGSTRSKTTKLSALARRMKLTHQEATAVVSTMKLRGLVALEKDNTGDVVLRQR